MPGAVFSVYWVQWVLQHPRAWPSVLPLYVPPRVVGADYSRFVKHERQERNSQKVTQLYDFSHKKVWL